VQAGDGCEYIIVLQQGSGLYDPEPLPALPPNARYLRHENRCWDIGTVGWVLEHHANARRAARACVF
jgi:translation initiation factor eIF-2B subunit epsilon